jgi:hypothetical protein
MTQVFALAAAMQLKEASLLAPLITEVVRGEPAYSGHPENGMRPEPDEMTSLVDQLVMPRGIEPSAYRGSEMAGLQDKFFGLPPVIMGNGDAKGFTVEYPFGKGSSLCQVKTDCPHPKYGNGLFLLQRFPMHGLDDASGRRMALEINGEQFTQKPSGYGFGSYVWQDGDLCFTGFLPNLLYKRGLLTNVFFSCAERAYHMSVKLLGKAWTAGSFKGRKSAGERLLDLFIS